MKVQALNDFIIFQFLNKTASIGFEESHHTLIISGKNFENSLKYARWAKVISVGPNVMNKIKEGDIVLIENLKWTNAVIIENEKYWRTTDKHILSKTDNLEIATTTI